MRRNTRAPRSARRCSRRRTAGNPPSRSGGKAPGLRGASGSAATGRRHKRPCGRPPPARPAVFPGTARQEGRKPCRTPAPASHTFDRLSAPGRIRPGCQPARVPTVRPCAAACPAGRSETAPSVPNCFAAAAYHGGSSVPRIYKTRSRRPFCRPPSGRCARKSPRGCPAGGRPPRQPKAAAWHQNPACKG